MGIESLIELTDKEVILGNTIRALLIKKELNTLRIFLRGTFFYIILEIWVLVFLEYGTQLHRLFDFKLAYLFHWNLHVYDLSLKISLYLRYIFVKSLNFAKTMTLFILHRASLQSTVWIKLLPLLSSLPFAKDSFLDEDIQIKIVLRKGIQVKHIFFQLLAQ